jgi:hypothetical protein
MFQPIETFSELQFFYAKYSAFITYLKPFSEKYKNQLYCSNSKVSFTFEPVGFNNDILYKIKVTCIESPSHKLCLEVKFIKNKGKLFVRDKFDVDPVDECTTLFNLYTSTNKYANFDSSPITTATQARTEVQKLLEEYEISKELKRREDLKNDKNNEDYKQRRGIDDL